MRIAVIGSKGMLGNDFCQYLKNHRLFPIEWDLPEMDITNVEDTIEKIKKAKPAIIFHCAAYTDVDGAETNKAQAYAVNTQGTWAIAIAAKDVKATLVYISTDYVFDGVKDSGYLESDLPNPINYYGTTKLLGEKIVTQLSEKYFIIRTSWLFGKVGKNFVSTILRLAREKEILEVVNDQIGSPTYTKDLCEPIFKLVNTDNYGIYHLTNSGVCSWYDFACAIIKESHLNTRVLPITSDKFIRPAKRPKNSVLENFKYGQIFKIKFRPWQEALKDFLTEI